MKKLFVILILGMLILSGCAQQTAENNEITNNDTGNTLIENEKTGTNVTDEFLELFNQTPNFKAVYVMTNNGVKGDGGQMAMYYRDGEIRKDILAGDILQRTWMLNNVVVACVKPGVLPEACEKRLRTETEPLTALKVNTDLIRENSEKYTITKLGLRKYATEFGECYKVEYTKENEKVTSEYCAAKKGIILYIKTISENEEGFLVSESEAVEVFDHVNDLDMTPPETETVQTEK